MPDLLKCGDVVEEEPVMDLLAGLRYRSQSLSDHVLQQADDANGLAFHRLLFQQAAAQRRLRREQPPKTERAY